MKKKFKNNKVLLVLALILIVCFILIVVALFKYFYSGNNTGKYGERLDGSESVVLAEDLSDTIKSIYESDVIDKVDLKLEGKIIYLTFNLVSVLKISDAKNLVLKSLEKFTDEEKSYYDIQFIIKCDNESSSSTENVLYPIMGYKNSTSSVVVWAGK